MQTTQLQPDDAFIPSAYSVYQNQLMKNKKKLKNNRTKKIKKNETHPKNKESPPIITKIRIKQKLHKNDFKQKTKTVELLKLKTIKKIVKNKKTKTVNKRNLQLNAKRKLSQQNEQDLDILANNEFVFSDNPVEDALKLFKWIITPIKPDVFFNDYWEKKTIHIKRLNENYYTQIFNSDVLDKILRNNYLEYTRNVDVVCYENGKKETYNGEGRATPSALWDYYSNGCSIRILNPQTYCNKIHLLLSTLQEYFGSMVGANVYLTPPNSQGFAPHYDDIEAFVIQLEGRKHWKLYHPKDADVLARFSSPNLSKKDIGDPFMELTLNAGEILYFPRGTIHEGYTDQNAHSLHITVSVYQRTSYADLLEYILPSALKKASENNVDYRRGLPLGYLKHLGVGVEGKYSKEFKNGVEMKVKNLTQLLLNYIDVDTAADSLGRKFMYDSMPPILSKNEIGRCSKADGPSLKNGEVLNRVVIDLDTKVRLLRYYCIRLIHEPNSTPKLYYNTENANVYHGEEEQYLELDISTIPIIQTLQATYPSYIEVGKLPMEDEISKMQCISDLWEHGLVVTEKPLRSII